MHFQLADICQKGLEGNITRDRRDEALGTLISHHPQEFLSCTSKIMFAILVIGTQAVSLHLRG
jgi:hypothetical protein